MSLAQSESLATIATIVGTIAAWAWMVTVLSQSLACPAIV